MHPASKKVAIFISNLNTGGAQRVAVNLSFFLSDAGHQVDIIVLGGNGDMVPLLHPSVRLWNFYTGSTVKAWKLLRRHLGSENPDVLISFMPHGNMVAGAAKATTRWKGKLIMTEHSDPRKSHTKGRGAKSWIMPLLNRNIYPAADHIVAVSNGVAGQLSDYLHLPRNAINTIYNPMDIEPQAKPGAVSHPWLLSPDTPCVLAAGRLVPDKGFDLLLEAFALALLRRPDLRLIIRGDGPDRQALERQAFELGIDQAVDMPGFTTDIRSEMAACDSFVLSSRWEGFGLVLAEAMAEGAKVVSFDCDFGPSEILHDGDYGILVPPQDIEALGKALIESVERPAPDYPDDLLRPYSGPEIAARYAALF